MDLSSILAYLDQLGAAADIDGSIVSRLGHDQ